MTVTVAVTDYIGVDPVTNVALADISGLGGSSEGSTDVYVSTNNDLGYKLEITAAGSPAMAKGGDSFADYAGPGAWSIAATDSAFGFSVDNNTSYQGLNGGTPIQIKTNGNEVVNELTTLFFKAEVGASKLQASGTYQADLTVTATTL
ncbi:MAG: hypothetical protein C4534_06755 [Gaiellales bacterium]|nr:MAG: hypothetical protein C4534_06755 [Gaiellales bacterium]